MSHQTNNKDKTFVVLLLIVICALCFSIAQQLDFGKQLTRLPVKETIATKIDTILDAVATTSLQDETPSAPRDVVDLDDAPLDTDKKLFIEVTDSCDSAYRGDCVVVRSAPTTSAAIAARLRNGAVFRAQAAASDGERQWYKILFEEWLRYPERVSGELYVAGDFVEAFYDVGTIETDVSGVVSNKKIVVDRSTQILTAYAGDEVFLEASISTGLELTPTPRGHFAIFKKAPTRYMQGPLPYLADKQYYDLPGVPWTLYFTEYGAAIHGTFWHEGFGTPQSHGCVNMTPAEAKVLYQWAEVGTAVIVQD